MTPKLSLKSSALILGVSPITPTRLSALDPTFPKLERIGRSIFIDSNKFYAWLSLKSGQEVTPSDTLLKSKDLQDYYQKSHTWCWIHVKNGDIPTPFKINRTNYWLEREIIGELEEVA